MKSTKLKYFSKESDWLLIGPSTVDKVVKANLATSVSLLLILINGEDIKKTTP